MWVKLGFRYMKRINEFYLSKSTRLIREDVLNLTEIVREIPASGDGRLIGLLIPYLAVKVDPSGLKGLDELDRDV